MPSDDSKEIIQWIKEHTDTFSENAVLLNSSSPEDILAVKAKAPDWFVHLRALNTIRHLNTFLANTSDCLDVGGQVFCRCTTSGVRKKQILKRYLPGLNYLLYMLDYIGHRVLPKLALTKNLYFGITKGKNRALTRVEVLGRLCRAGFDVIHEEVINSELYILASKIKEPVRDDNPSNGILIRLNRRGKNAKMIGVYKFRTMYAYAEYVQSYIYKQEGLATGGKIKDDYRINTLGKFLRRTWLDELPMLLNWLKGDLKLVGVRPLSDHYFTLYSEQLQRLRIKAKPGLLPPFYADMPATLEEIQESEERYLKSYLEHPFSTDWTYFCRIMKNIVLKGK
jgi:lipopolysaccharide/colanic/teichoic acid biosynthesis glycosyltransferase